MFLPEYWLWVESATNTTVSWNRGEYLFTVNHLSCPHAPGVRMESKCNSEKCKGVKYWCCIDPHGIDVKQTSPHVRYMMYLRIMWGWYWSDEKQGRLVWRSRLNIWGKEEGGSGGLNKSRVVFIIFSPTNSISPRLMGLRNTSTGGRGLYLSFSCLFQGN